MDVVVGCLGFGKRAPEVEARRIVARALERGLRTFDVADVYEGGRAEEILGAALAGRDDARVVTKIGLRGGLGAAAVRAGIEKARARLKRDAIDVLLFHAPDRATPVAESVEALAEAHARGLVRGWGWSNHGAFRAGELLAAARAGGLGAPVCGQMLYNACVRQLELEYFDFARTVGAPTWAYNPLAGGLLSGKYEGRAPEKGERLAVPMYAKRYGSRTMTALAAELAAAAREAGLSPAALAYGFLAGRAELAAVVCGPAEAAHVDAAIDGLARPLPDDVRSRVDAIVASSIGTDASYAR